MQRCMKYQKIRCTEWEQDVFEAERSSSNTKWISAPVKRQNETRNRSLISKNAFPPRETDQNFRKTPSRGGKWGKFSEKRLPATGNGKNSQKNGFPRREKGQILRKTLSAARRAFPRSRRPRRGKRPPPASLQFASFAPQITYLFIYVTNEDCNRWNGLRRSCHRHLFC